MMYHDISLFVSINASLRNFYFCKLCHLLFQDTHNAMPSANSPIHGHKSSIEKSRTLKQLDDDIKEMKQTIKRSQQSQLESNKNLEIRLLNGLSDVVTQLTASASLKSGSDSRSHRASSQRKKSINGQKLASSKSNKKMHHTSK